MSDKVSVYKCIHCDQPLTIAFPTAAEVICGCGRHYPVISGIPVLVDRIPSYLAEAYYLYYQHTASLDYQVNVVRDNFAFVPSRQDVKTTFIEALQHNRRAVERIVKVLEPYTSVQEVLRVQTNPLNETHRYLKDFDYLRRDWGGDEEGEAQLAVINASLQRAVEEFLPDKGQILILGAGTGRIAYEFTKQFDTVLATDLSFSMAYHFHEVLRNGVSFYELNTQNVYYRHAFTRKINAQQRNTDARLRPEAVQYFISDVKRLPLQDHSVACIASVYFTDVLALRLWLPEVKRVLKPGGVFMHFGPLGYPFEDFREKLSAEEIMDVFREHQFEILSDDLLTTGHLASPQSLTQTHYKNWMLVTRKSYEATGDGEISLDSILKIRGEIRYRVEGTLSFKAAGNNSNCFIFNERGHKIKGSEFILNLLKRMDGQQTVGEIIRELSASYDIGPDEEAEILQMFRNMADEHLIQVAAVRTA